MTIKVRVTGGSQVAHALSTLGRRSSEEKVLRAALRPGARAIAEAAKAGAPVDTGALRRSIAIGILRTKSRAARLVIGHRKDDPHSRWRISHIIEFGSRFMSARPYMRQAAATAGEGAIRLFGQNVWSLIAKEATRLASRQALRRR
jgi:HK97 gp10 family phage protein